MKRFWKEAVAHRVPEGWEIRLDGRPVRTPGKNMLLAPNEAVAQAVVAEWDGQETEVDPRQMPNTGYLNAAIDRISADPELFVTEIAKFAESDLLCYRAEGPASLVARQADAWDPVLDWAREYYGVEFRVTSGIAFVAQPDATIARLREEVAIRSAIELAPLSTLASISGSLILALAVHEERLAPADAFAISTIDEQWQTENWGEDSLATAATENRQRDFLAAARLLELLKA